MKKLILLAMCMVLIGAGVAKVYADPYVTGTDITINDNAQSGGLAIGASFSYNQGAAPLKGEDQETEPGTINTQPWDLEAFQQKKNILSIIGGFPFATGSPGGYTPVQPLGDLFLKSTAGAPAYGFGALPGGNNGTGDSNNAILNSANWGYNYAIRFNFSNPSALTYTVWTPGSGATDLMHGPSGPATSECANPWQMGTGWTQVGGTHAFTYYTGQTDAAVGGYLGDEGGVGSHNVIDGIDLSFLIDPAHPELGNPLTWLHLTYDCGNDNLMGQVPANSVPIPPSALLLGTGLLGLAGLGWRRRQTNA